VLSAGEWEAAIHRVETRELDPYTAADGLVRRALAGSERP